jgi:hypothetical protein
VKYRILYNKEILDVQLGRHGIYAEFWWGKLLKN